MRSVLLLDIGGVLLRSGHEMMALLERRRPELAGETDRRGRLRPVPDPRWEPALEAPGHPDPADVVFLDDMPGNVAGGRAAGLTTVWVDLEAPGAAFASARQLLDLEARVA